MKRRYRCTAGTLVVILLVWTGLATAQDWDQWRGPQRDGWAGGQPLPPIWPEALDKVWQVEVGSGHASPLVVGERVYIFSRTADSEGIRCLALETGALLWRQDYAAPYTMNSSALGHGKGPKATPVYNAGRLYTLGISGILSCFDGEAGSLVWQRHFAEDFARRAPEFGASTSPLVVEGFVIVYVGGPGDGALMAFDGTSGQTRWQWTGDGPGYSSPVLAQMDGTPQLVTQSQEYCLGVAPHSGKVLWQVPYTTPYRQNIITPIARGDTVFFSGLSQGTMALRVVRTAAGWTTEKLWENREVGFYMSSPLYYRGRLLGLAHQRQGQYVCLDAGTGALKWHSAGRQAESAALIGVAHSLVALQSDAQLVVFAADSDSFKVLARHQVATRPVWAHPAPTANGLLVKSETQLMRWSWK